jgi:hypothetical protein
MGLSIVENNNPYYCHDFLFDVNGVNVRQHYKAISTIDHSSRSFSDIHWKLGIIHVSKGRIELQVKKLQPP